MYQLTVADKLYHYERTRRRQARTTAINRQVVGRYTTITEAAAARLKYLKTNPDAVLYVSRTRRIDDTD